MAGAFDAGRSPLSTGDHAAIPDGFRGRIDSGGEAAVGAAGRLRDRVAGVAQGGRDEGADLTVAL